MYYANARFRSTGATSEFVQDYMKEKTLKQKILKLY